jgi:uncharacterized protein (DUF362 family)
VKILLAHPGADTSTVDVYHGIAAALRNQGHAIITFRLDGRLIAAGSWFTHQQRRCASSRISCS